MTIGNSGNGSGWLTQPGASLRAQNIRYLQPVITYNSPISGDVTLYVKIIDPDGTIFRNSSTSPAGYAFSTNSHIIRGSNKEIVLSGWGNASSSIYRTGQWTIEVWYEGVCLRSEKIRLN
jgi:hypothetical protein